MCARAKQTRRIGWIGLGTMGLPMALRLADKSGCAVHGCDIVPAAMDAFASMGGIPEPDGAALLEEACQSVQTPYALVFGNEGSGLPPEFARLGRAVRIPHNDQIDSLNLSVAVGIGAYAFVHAAGRG